MATPKHVETKNTSGRAGIGKTPAPALRRRLVRATSGLTGGLLDLAFRAESLHPTRPCSSMDCPYMIAIKKALQEVADLEQVLMELEKEHT